MGFDIFDGKKEKQVDRAQSEERDVAQSIKPPPEAAVSPKPIIPVKKHAQPETGKKAQPDPEPSKQKINKRYSHAFLVPALQLATWIEKVLIEKNFPISPLEMELDRELASARKFDVKEQFQGCVIRGGKFYRFFTDLTDFFRQKIIFSGSYWV